MLSALGHKNAAHTVGVRTHTGRMTRLNRKALIECVCTEKPQLLDTEAWVRTALVYCLNKLWYLDSMEVDVQCLSYENTVKSI